jgi:alanine racemase
MRNIKQTFLFQRDHLIRSGLSGGSSIYLPLFTFLGRSCQSLFISGGAAREIFLTKFPVSLKNRRERKRYLIMSRKKQPGAERPTQAVVNLKAISDNIARIRKRIGAGRDLMAVVKADAYGHGAVQVSRAAIRSGASCLGVSSPEEAEELREAGIDIPILVLGLIQPEAASKSVGLKLEQTLCSLELAAALDQESRKASTRINVHVKVDTGMGRIGVLPEDALAFVRRVRRFKNLNLTGIFSHFSSADDADKTFAIRQLEIFNGVTREIEAAGIHIPKKHMANSAAILDLPQSYLNLVRPGIMIYGLYPSPHVSRSIKLRPAMTLRTRVSYIKSVPAGTPISYGCTFITQKETRVATLPVGYADGYSRLLSNQGTVLIKGQRAPLIGRVCMDMCLADVSGIKNVRVGDEVILFGEELSVDEVASNMGTINYEVVCGVGKRVPRVYVEEP